NKNWQDTLFMKHTIEYTPVNVFFAVVGPVVEYDRAASDEIMKIEEQKVPATGKKPKRGYNKYTPEQKAEMGKYAREFGSTAAAKHFSKQYNMKIDESSVRMFKSKVAQKTQPPRKKPKREYNKYTPEQKAEMGKYAMEFGSTAAAKHFSKQFNMKIEESSVRMFKSKVAQKTSTPSKKPKTKREYNKYTPEQKAEMGKYAMEFGNVAAAKHFSKKYSMDIDESVVRRYKSEVAKHLKNVDLEDIGYIKTSNRGRPTILPADIESEMFRYIETLHASGTPVDTTLIHSAIKRIVQQKNKKLLSENGGHIEITKSLVPSLANRMGFSKNILM
ncbi:unnamed protein product, partial [Owenia fusiformis]